MIKSLLHALCMWEMDYGFSVFGLGIHGLCVLHSIFFPQPSSVLSLKLQPTYIPYHDKVTFKCFPEQNNKIPNNILPLLSRNNF